MGLLTKIYTSINNHILFDPEKNQPPVKAQKDFFSSFPDPKDDVERSFFKYQCLLFCSYSRHQKLLVNTLCFFALSLFIIYYRLRGLKFDYDLSNYKPQDLLLRKIGKTIPIADIFPEKLNGYFAETVDYQGIPYKKLFISNDAYLLFKKVSARHRFAFHYRLVVLMRLASACFLLANYHPRAVTTYVCEREFADPLLTSFYQAHGVEYHGFMHGDYLFSIQFAFMKLSKYWIWSDHYERMFRSLNCEFETEIYTPGKYSGIVKPRKSVEDYDYYATYYFSDETKASIELVKDALLKIKAKGLKCKVRPHPRFSNKEAIRQSFEKDFYVEDPAQTTIESSLENTYLTIALVSTVLSQAYYSKKKIVIDDISNPSKYLELFDKDYILIDKADYLLSDLIK